MTAPNDVALLELWEASAKYPRPLQGVALLSAVGGAPIEEHLRQPLGQVARTLLTRRVEWFGPTLSAVCTCVGCGARIEALVDLRELLQRDSRAAEHFDVVCGDLRVTVRLPTTEDLMTASREHDVAAAREVLLAHCVSNARGEGRPWEGEQLPVELIEAVAAAMEAADPLAEIVLDLRCPSCEMDAHMSLDPARFLTADIDRAAREIMTDVHLLASAYGWTEDETLRLSPRRRRAYVERADS